MWKILYRLVQDFAISCTYSVSLRASNDPVSVHTNVLSTYQVSKTLEKKKRWKYRVVSTLYQMHLAVLYQMVQTLYQVYHLIFPVYAGCWSGKYHPYHKGWNYKPWARQISGASSRIYPQCLLEMIPKCMWKDRWEIIAAILYWMHMVVKLLERSRTKNG